MNRALISRLVRYGISAAVIVLLIIFAGRVNWGEAWTAMRTASLPLLLAATAANLSSLVFRGIRWWILLRESGSRSFNLAMRATFTGSGLNNVLLANGGEAARVVFVTRASGASSAKVIATAALDRLFDPVGFVALLAFGAVAFDLPPSLERLRWPAIITLLLLTVLLIWLGRKAEPVEPEDVTERRATPRGWRRRLRAWLGELGGNMRDLASGPRIIWMVLLTLLAWIGQLLTFILAAAAAHVRLPIPGSLTALLAVNISGIVRATPGNVGVFQFTYTLATSPFSVPDAAAVALSLLIQTIQIIPVTIIGVALAPEFLFKRKAPTPG